MSGSEGREDPSGPAPRIAVVGEELAAIAARLHAPLVTAAAAAEFDVIVVRDRVLGCLGIAFEPGGQVVTAGPDRRAMRDDPLPRALGVHRGVQSVLDATAGLGRDAFLLAALGVRVTMVERHPVLVALLDDALATLPGDDPTRARLTLVEGDAREVLAALPQDERPDAVYLDPMFAPRGKRALPGLAAQLLRALAGEGENDDEELLELARRVARRRVVVKRHPKAPALGGQAESSVGGSRIRFDVYTPR